MLETEPNSLSIYLATPPPRLSSCNEEDKSAATPRPAAAIPAISSGPLSVEGLPTWEGECIWSWELLVGNNFDPDRAQSVWECARVERVGRCVVPEQGSQGCASRGDYRGEDGGELREEGLGLLAVLVLVARVNCVRVHHLVKEFKRIVFEESIFHLRALGCSTFWDRDWDWEGGTVGTHLVRVLLDHEVIVGRSDHGGERAWVWNLRGTK